MKGWAENSKLDYTGVSTDAPKPLDDGLYKARISEAKPAPTKEQKPMIKLTVDVFEDDSGNAVKRKITDNLVLSQAALFRVLIIAKALDIEPPGDTSLETAEDFCRELVKAAKDGVWVRVGSRTYKRNDGSEGTSNEIKRYLSDADVAEAKEKAEAKSEEPEEKPARRPRGNSVSAAS